MKIIKHIVVGLDLSTMDKYLLNYAAFIFRRLGPEKISFIHVTPSFTLLEELQEIDDDEYEPLDVLIQNEMEEIIDAEFTPHVQGDIEKNIVVLEGETSEQFIRFSVKSDADLILLGKKSGLRGAGATLKQIISLSPCSVMLASELAPHSIDNILLPMNFSKHARLAFERANMLSKYFGAKYFMQYVNTEVSFNGLLQNQFFNNFNYDKSKFKEEVVKKAKEKFKSFLKKVEKTEDELPAIKFSVNTDGDPSYTIYRYAVKQKADLILLGAGIRSSYSNLFLDSVSEKLAGYDMTIPIYIVKDKERNLKKINSIF
ncbi:universal stress protein [Sediminitomix flava]|uniref:Nucleotide-binding universal stress UspA family protein n=1 Tax=Sediminitomix flava TaxID=379075 RepID=A0A315ZT75_SEDFL|nr:universal stress protein [Sediminitomix flava]PWJ38424.1 nucleotide-binding universal stress UspA family protein [Sediminitomix flava]